MFLGDKSEAIRLDETQHGGRKQVERLVNIRNLGNLKLMLKVSTIYRFHGTAMGTRMAYANLFLAKFETDAYVPHSNHTYFIDDIFLIWTHSLETHSLFTTYLNNIHPIIKFTPNYSITSIPFLDSVTAPSLPTFTLRLLTDTNTCYNLHAIIDTPRELFHLA